MCLVNMTAQGFRRGCINECMSKMPSDFVAQCTGHELRSLSALYEYLNASRSMLQPGNEVGIMSVYIYSTCIQHLILFVHM